MSRKFRHRCSILLSSLLISLLIFAGYKFNQIYVGSIIGSLFLIALGYSFLSARENRTVTSQKPRVTALVPAYKDHEIIENSINSLKESDYPELDIKVICEPEDPKTIEKVQEFDLPNLELLIEKSPESSKARALNYGFSKSESEIIAIFDSDQIVPSDFIGKGVSYLDNYDAFQGRVLQKPKNLVGEVAYLEGLFYSDAAKESFRLMTGRFQPRSKALIINKSVLTDLNGFRHGRLTEDIDFGERFSRTNYKAFKDLKGEPVVESAPRSLEDWLKHRIKWATGFLETLKHNGSNAGIKNNFGLVGTFLGLNLVIFMLGQFFALLLGKNNYHILSPVITSAIICLGIRINDRIKNYTENIGSVWSYSAFIFPLMSSIMIYSAIKLILGLETEWHNIDKQH